MFRKSIIISGIKRIRGISNSREHDGQRNELQVAGNKKARQDWQAVYYPFVCSNLGYWIEKLANLFSPVHHAQASAVYGRLLTVCQDGCFSFIYRVTAVTPKKITITRHTLQVRHMSKGFQIIYCCIHIAAGHGVVYV